MAEWDGPAGPSLRGRLLRNLLNTTVRMLRRWRGGVPDPADAVALEAYGLAMRGQLEGLGARIRLPDHVSCEPSGDQRVAGLWIADRRTARPGRAVMYLHGGGHVAGSPHTHRQLAAALSRVTCAPVFLPRYRLAPEHPYPAALDDVSEAFEYLTDGRGLSPAKLVVGGDSSGAGLALAALMRRRDAGQRLPAAYVGFAPWVDLAGSGESLTVTRRADPWLSPQLVVPAGRAYAGDQPVDDPLVSPLYGDLSGLPPMLVHVGSRDVLLDDARRLVECARAVGVDAALAVFPGMWHVFQFFPTPETRRSLQEVGGFVRRHLAGTADQGV